MSPADSPKRAAERRWPRLNIVGVRRALRALIPEPRREPRPSVGPQIR